MESQRLRGRLRDGWHAKAWAEESKSKPDLKCNFKFYLD